MWNARHTAYIYSLIDFTLVTLRTAVKSHSVHGNVGHLFVWDFHLLKGRNKAKSHVEFVTLLINTIKCVIKMYLEK